MYSILLTIFFYLFLLFGFFLLIMVKFEMSVCCYFMNDKVMGLERNARDQLVNQPSKRQDLFIATLQKHRKKSLFNLLYRSQMTRIEQICWKGLCFFLSYLFWPFLAAFSIIYEALRELILPFLFSVAFYTFVYTFISPAYMTCYIFRSLSGFCSAYADLPITKMKMPGTELLQTPS